MTTILEPSDTPPPVKSRDELMTRKQFSEWLNVSEHTIDQWRYGRQGTFVPLPYLRLANRVYLWEGGIIWWINKQAERPDFFYLDRKKRLEEGKKVGTKRNRTSSK